MLNFGLNWSTLKTLSRVDVFSPWLVAVTAIGITDPTFLSGPMYVLFLFDLFLFTILNIPYFF